MLFGINNLLLNILIIIISIIIFFGCTSKLSKKHWGIAIGLLSAVTVVLCMTFPFSILPGYNYDLRVIPLLIGILYGGFVPGIFVSTVLFAYRFYLGGAGFYYTSLALPLVIMIALYFSYQVYSRNKKMVIGIVLNLVAIGSSSICLFVFIGPLSIKNVSGYFLINAVTMWMAMYLIETLRENRVMRKEMSRAEKLNVLGDLAASIAHEIRNPMTVARGFMQLMTQQNMLDQKNQTYINMVIKELDRAESIISDYLSLAKPKVEKLDIVDVAGPIQHVSNVVSSYAILRNVEIEIELEPSLFITANPEKLSQVLMNFIKNGVEAMPDGGTLNVYASKRDGRIIIDIIDHGMGMTVDELKRLGNPFYSTKETGTGLGLMISYSIIHAMNGKVEVKSEKGKYTKFSLSIPAA